MMRGWDEGQKILSSIEVILPAFRFGQMFSVPLSKIYPQRACSVTSDVSGVNYRDN